ncbi:hypothetical protein Ahy_A07g035803 [Arachis hypogaea]|uniref:Uncharacterized protein n=1 Tax=Arachis hypogaea TaxID=3818 RepID=A0A445CEF7_ARAHY|nr:hypothetical protein Ahy_A07g035803 [Arachis hypogaea]
MTLVFESFQMLCCIIHILASKTYQSFVIVAGGHRELNFVEKDEKNYTAREVQNKQSGFWFFSRGESPWSVNTSGMCFDENEEMLLNAFLPINARQCERITEDCMPTAIHRWCI